MKTTKEAEREIKEIRMEIIKEEFCKGFALDYMSCAFEHPIETAVAGTVANAAINTAVKAVVGAVPLPIRIAGHIVGALALPTLFGAKRAIEAQKAFDIQRA